MKILSFVKRAHVHSQACACSFCGKASDDDSVGVVVAGPNVFICDVCVKQAQSAVDDFECRRLANRRI
jgi:hypothetical protein